MALTRRDVTRALRMDRAAVDRLARKLYAAKSRQYRKTLTELTHRFGAGRNAVLSTEIRDALMREARDHAKIIAATNNRLLTAEAGRRRELPAPLLARHLRGYMGERSRNRAPTISRTELATAQLDAQVAFFRENGIEPLFDFAGPPAKCPVCARLKESGPHPIEIVLKIGYPHPNCTHTWRARRVTAKRLLEGGIRPGQISAGRGEIAGIVGSDPLVIRTGSTEDAVAAIDTVLAGGVA